MGLEVFLIFAVSLSAAAYVSSRLANFRDIVRQRTDGNKIEQCPCVLHPESGRCIVYNARYQATNIEEAMFTFHDLTSPPDPELDAVSFSCKTIQCQQCFSLLYYHLVDNNIVEKDFRPVTPLLPRSAVQPSLCPRYRFLKDVNIPPLPELVPPHVQTMIINGLQSAGKPLPQGTLGTLPRPWPGRLEQFGPRQQQQQQVPAPPQLRGRQGPSAGWIWNPRARQWQYIPSSTVADGTGKSIANVSSTIATPSPEAPQTFINQPFSGDWNAQEFPDGRYSVPYGRPKGPWQHREQIQPTGNYGDGDFVPPPVTLGGYGKRKKRAAKQSIIGSRFIIGCSNRGESDDNLLALCGSCWAWRELPEDYFPRLLNELSCKENDFCLSGWGECVQQFRNVDVLRRVGGQWQSAALSVATCCDCRVRAGTEVHSLVVGDRNRIVLT